MSIESEIADLRGAIRALTDAILQSAGAPQPHATSEAPKVVKLPTKAEAPAPKAEAAQPKPKAEAKAPAPAPKAAPAEAPAVTQDDVRAALIRATAVIGRTAMVALLQDQFGVATGGAIPQERWAEAIAAFSAAEGAK